MNSPRVTIIGAGPAGLTAAYLLAKAKVPVVVFEADPRYVGGISKTVEYKGFHFDIGGHRFFSKSKEVEDLWTEILPDDMLVRPRSSRILYRQKFFSYPLKAFEALRKLGIIESLLCVLSYAKARVLPIRNPRNFEEWVSNQFGKRLFNIFFKTYTEKVWGTPCTEISADWAAQRIKGLSLSTAILSALLPKRKAKSRGDVVKTLIDSFRYPRRGPGMLWERCAERIQQMGSEVRMGWRVSKCEFDAASGRWTTTVTDSAGREELIQSEHVISTTPIRELAGILHPPLSEQARDAADRLKYRDFITVAVILNERDVFDDNWIYVHDPSVQVGRIQNFKSWSPEMTPDASLACYGLEYFCFEEGAGLWSLSDDALKDLAKRELVQLGLAKLEDIQDACVVRQKKAYPVYDDAYAEHVATVGADLAARFPGLHLIGRNGMHKYNNQDHSMMTAMLCVENIQAGEQRFDLWRVNEDAEYHEAGDRGASVTGLRQVPKTVPPPVPEARRSWWSSKMWIFIVFAMLVLPFVMTLGMTRGLTHDEHQHIAAGELLAQSGLLPYRDFAYFHTPYLPLIYAGIFYFTDHLLLSSRLFSVACAVASLAALGLAILQLFRNRRPGVGWAAALSGVALALFSPVFVETAGHAWNQEPALLFALLAFLAHLAGIPMASGRKLFLAGALLGLAIGLRITFAPLFAPFVMALWMSPETRGRRTPLIAAFSAGVALSLSGLACLFIAAPEQTWFGNFGFAGVNITYRFDTGEPRTMTLLKKMRYVFKEIMRPDAGLMLASLVSFGALFLSRRSTSLKLPLGFRFLLLSLPFLLIGSLAPSPLFNQYFYPFVFFLPLGSAYALAALPSESPWLRRAAIGSSLGLVIAVCMGAGAYKNLTKLAAVEDWDPIRIHEEGVEIRKKIGSGEILTLAPTYAMEGGAKIYPSFSTGPFAWRVSPYIEAGKAARLKITTLQTLEAMLDANPPEGILLGKEKRGEDALGQFAIDNGFEMIALRETVRLWIPKRPAVR